MTDVKKITDGKKVKDYLQAKGHTKTKLDKLKWNTSVDIIESTVKLHGQTPENYRNSGLG
jgi:hypothetical protein